MYTIDFKQSRPEFASERRVSVSDYVFWQSMKLGEKIGQP